MLSTNTLTEDVLEIITPEQTNDVARLSASTDLGMSSAGLIRWAAKGGGDVMAYTDYRPLDDDDLGRCERAYAKAPQWLAERMLSLLWTFRAEVAEANIKRAKTGATRAERQYFAEKATRQECAQFI